PPCSTSYSARHSNPGSNGSNGTSGSAVNNYDHGGGATVFTGNATANAQSVGGLYQSTGSLNQDALTKASATNRLPGVVVELHSEDGGLIAVTKTDNDGKYRFKTNFSGMGYVQFGPQSIHIPADKGSRLPGGITSAFDPKTGKSDVVYFINGVAVNTNLNLILQPIEKKLVVGDRAIGSINTNTGDFLWKTRLMPVSYKGGFTVVSTDINADTTPDYLAIARTGAALVFIVDGRTGKAIKMEGSVSPVLRYGFSILTAHLNSDNYEDLILVPARNRSARISTIDLQAGRVLWNANDIVLGGMTVMPVGANHSGDFILKNIEISSKRVPNTYKLLAGSSGQVIEALTPQTRKAESRRAAIHQKFDTQDTMAMANSEVKAGTAKLAVVARRNLPSVPKRNLRPML
ncbi:MAG: hypothetical protein ACKO0V_08125, partial [bacterium]